MWCFRMVQSSKLDSIIFQNEWMSLVESNDGDISSIDRCIVISCHVRNYNRGSRSDIIPNPVGMVVVMVAWSDVLDLFSKVFLTH